MKEVKSTLNVNYELERRSIAHPNVKNSLNTLLSESSRLNHIEASYGQNSLWASFGKVQGVLAARFNVKLQRRSIARWEEQNELMLVLFESSRLDHYEKF